MRSIIQLVDSSKIGGIETHIFQLSSALIREGYRCEVIFVADHGAHPLKDQLTRAQIPWDTLPSGFIAQTRFLRHRAVLVNTHGYKAGIVGRLICRLSNIPVVSTWHAGETGRGRLRLYQWLDHATAMLAPAMAVSNAIAAQLPVDSTLIRNFTHCPPMQSSSGQSIGFVGRLSHEKAPDLFCQILSRVSPRHPPLVFGSGALRDVLEQRYSPQIQFRGAVTSMDSHWQELSLLCISSRAEGLPLAALEAMANGVPVAAFAVGALPELIRDGENGFLVPAGDLEGMQRALERWLAMTAAERLAIIAAARHTIEQQYSARAALPQIEAVYQQQTDRLEVAQL